MVDILRMFMLPVIIDWLRHTW